MEDGLVPANRSSIEPSTDLISQIHIGVIIAVTLVVATIFLAVYVQLMLVICYGYKLVSYQTVFLFNILLWSSLRLTLYSFYYYHCCELANNLPSFPNWLLLSAPSIFLFLSLALLVHYFMEVSNNDMYTPYALSPSSFSLPLCTVFLIIPFYL